jgi:pyrimidine deaminase RibD-like protein
MRYCLGLTLRCPVSPTAFCVGSTLFLPSSSLYYQPLSSVFPPFIPPAPDGTIVEIEEGGANAAGLILGDGYSRQIPGNTHAEANALTNFRARYAELSSTAENRVDSLSGQALPAIDEVLKDVECFATMEPCSVRTSGGPSCALELVRARVKRVYLVSASAMLIRCGTLISTTGCGRAARFCAM